MKIVKDESLSILHHVFGWRGRDRLSLAVIAGFTLDERQDLVDEASVWDRVAPELGRNGVLDLCMPKPKGEVLVLGKCFAGPDKEVRVATAFFRVGRLEKRVEVFGDRYFKLGLIGSRYVQPQPFSVMDIAWEKAFGGPGCEMNPVGKGMLPVHTSQGDRLVPMPNIENPARLMTAPDDRPEPAGLGPMGLNWPGRLKKLGTFDRRWLLERWPGLPDDFDFGYYNLAPADQRMDEWFKGNEFILVRGMHPVVHEIQSRLPNRRCRLFMDRANGDDGSFREISTNLDTVCLIPHLELGLLIWHGTAEVADDEAGDVLHIAAFQETLDETPQSEAFYRQKLDEPDDEPPLEIELPEAPAPEPGPPEVPEAPEPVVSPEALALAASLEKEIAAKEALFDRRLMEWGIDPKNIEPPPLPEKVVPLPKPDLSPEAFLDKMEKSAADQENKLNAFLKSHGVDPDGPLPEPPPVPAGPDMSNAGAFLTHFIKLGVTDQESLDELRDLYQDHQTAAAELAVLHDGLQQVELPTGPDSPPDPAESKTPEAIPYTKARVLDAYQQGRSLQGADLTGLDLSDCSLPGIDLSGAMLEKTNLSGADLTGAKMDDAILTGADFSRSRLADAFLTGAVAVEAAFREADLTGSNLTGADFTKSDLSKAKLSQAILTGSLLNNALLTETDGSGILAAGAELQGADLTGAVFKNADLREADLTGATLDGAGFQEIRGEELRLYGVKGQKVDFSGGQLTRSRTGDDASLPGARFTSADLSGAAWEETDLTGADFSGARMVKAKINRCRLPEAGLSGIQARGTDFSKSDLSRARMAAIDLLGGSLRKCNLAETDLRIANLHGVDLYKANMIKTRVEGANLDRTLLTVHKTKLK